MSYEELSARRPRAPEAGARSDATPTSGRCSTTASARSPARFATRSTSTARRTAAARSPTSSSAAPPRTSRASPRRCRLSLGVEVRPATVGVVEGGARRRRLAPPARRRDRPGRDGGAPMRAVNLIPSDQRSGGSVGAGRSDGAAYAVLALLVGVAVLAVLYGKASRTVSSDKAKAATLTAQAQRAQGGQPKRSRPTRASWRCASSAKQAVDLARRLALRLGARLPRARPRPERPDLDHRRSTARSARPDRLGCRRFLLLRPPPPSSAAAARRAGLLGDACRQRADLHAQRLRDEPEGRRPDAPAAAPDRRRHTK